MEIYDLMDETIIYRAKPARSAKVIVMDAYLKPLKGAKVLVKTMYGLKGVESSAGFTNADGELTVPAVYHGGKYVFRAVLSGYCPNATTAPPVGSKNWIDSIEIVTEPATTVVKGKVVDTKGNQVAGAKVTTDFGLSALTDAKGAFALKQMPSWAVRLDVRKGKLSGSNVDAKGNLSRVKEPVIVVR